MTESTNPDRDRSSVPDSEVDAAEVHLRKLMIGALDSGQKSSPDVLKGVQRKLRERSGGKFYADGWTTTRFAPISTYLVTSLMMLTFMAFIYFVLHPLSGKPETVRSVPVPVEILAPRR